MKYFSFVNLHARHFYQQEDAQLWFSGISYANSDTVRENMTIDKEKTEASISILKRAGLIRSDSIIRF
jgi:hypothetical protein